MKRLPIRKIREVLRLRADGLSGRQAARSLSLTRSTVSEYFRRADVVGLPWPLSDTLSDADLEGERPLCQRRFKSRQLCGAPWGVMPSNSAHAPRRVGRQANLLCYTNRRMH